LGVEPSPRPWHGRHLRLHPRLLLLLTGPDRLLPELRLAHHRRLLLLTGPDRLLTHARNLLAERLVRGLPTDLLLGRCAELRERGRHDGGAPARRLDQDVRVDVRRQLALRRQRL
jgi:hypothetical protein